jgi:hypothetical protein
LSRLYKANATLKIKDFSIKVCIKEKENPETSGAIGYQGVILNFVGNVVDSGQTNKRILPDSIKSDDRGYIDIDEKNLHGEFVFQSIHKTRWKTLENSLGQHFTGFMILESDTKNEDWV